LLLLWLAREVGADGSLSWSSLSDGGLGWARLLLPLLWSARAMVVVV